MTPNWLLQLRFEVHLRAKKKIHGTIWNNHRELKTAKKSSLAFIFGVTAIWKALGDAPRPRSVGLGTDDGHSVWFARDRYRREWIQQYSSEVFRVKAYHCRLQCKCSVEVIVANSQSQLDYRQIPFITISIRLLSGLSLEKFVSHHRVVNPVVSCLLMQYAQVPFPKNWFPRNISLNHINIQMEASFFSSAVTKIEQLLLLSRWQYVRT